MTGIERLREIVCELGDISFCYDLYTRLGAIADQIERELSDERDRWESDLYEAQVAWNRVMGVCLEMERHILGHEGMGDSPVARWARELRHALKSDTSDGSDAQNPSWHDPDGAADVTSGAAKVTRDPAADVSVSAYDLLPQEDRDAIAWVRDHGGLDHVKAEWRSRVPYDRYVRRRQSLLGHIAECETALGRRREIISSLGHRVSDLTTENAELRRRAMPEGMEWLVEAWPKFEDGEPVKLPDDFERYGEETSVSAVTMYADGSFALNCRAYSKGERVNRPAPKAIDADGVEIRVKETVFDKNTGEELIVIGFEDGRVWCEHRMTDADALPVRGMWSPGLLTHKRPEIDSWERLEEDATIEPHAYCTGNGLFGGQDEHDPAFPASELMARDLVRRARALAGGA